MKQLTTEKAITSKYNKIIQIGYCKLQNLLTMFEPVACTNSIYGWDADIYVFDDVVIVTGDRPFGNIKPDKDIIKKYNDEALQFRKDWRNINHKDRFITMLNEFIEEVTR